MSAGATITLSGEDEAEQAFRYWKEQFKLLRATGDLTIRLRFADGGMRRGELEIKQLLQSKGRRQA